MILLLSAVLASELTIALDKQPTTEEAAREAQDAWLRYATAATAAVWPTFEAELKDMKLPGASYAWNARLVVDPEGKLVIVTLSEGSGHAAADAALIAAFQQVGLFGPPPKVWIQTTDEAVFDGLVFTYERQADPGALEVPYER